MKITVPILNVEIQTHRGPFRELAKKFRHETTDRAPGNDQGRLSFNKRFRLLQFTRLQRPANPAQDNTALPTVHDIHHSEIDVVREHPAAGKAGVAGPSTRKFLDGSEATPSQDVSSARVAEGVSGSRKGKEVMDSFRTNKAPEPSPRLPQGENALVPSASSPSVPEKPVSDPANVLIEKSRHEQQEKFEQRIDDQIARTGKVTINLRDDDDLKTVQYALSACVTNRHARDESGNQIPKPVTHLESLDISVTTAEPEKDPAKAGPAKPGLDELISTLQSVQKQNPKLRHLGLELNHESNSGRTEFAARRILESVHVTHLDVSCNALAGRDVEETLALEKAFRMHPTIRSVCLPKWIDPTTFLAILENSNLRRLTLRRFERWPKPPENLSNVRNGRDVQSEIQDKFKRAQLTHVDFSRSRLPRKLIELVFEKRQIEHINLSGVRLSSVLLANEEKFDVDLNIDYRSALTQYFHEARVPTTLNLSGTRIPATTIKGIFQNPYFIDVDLSNNNLSKAAGLKPPDEGRVDIGLRKLNLNSTRLPTEAFESLGTFPLLETLSIANNRLTASSITKIVSANTTLSKLQLSDNKLRDINPHAGTFFNRKDRVKNKELKELFTALAAHPKIADLGLSDCDLGPEDAKYIADILLPNMQSLTRLDLEGNHIDLQGLKLILNAVKKGSPLRVLYLADNLPQSEQGQLKEDVEGMKMSHPDLKVKYLSTRSWRSPKVEGVRN